MAKGTTVGLTITDEKGTLEGILTERYLAQDATAAGFHPTNTLIHEVITASPDTISLDDLAIDPFELMQTREYHH